MVFLEGTWLKSIDFELLIIPTSSLLFLTPSMPKIADRWVKTLSFYVNVGG